MKNKILVTGADGFIGKAVIKALRGINTDVVLLTHYDGDISDIKTLEKIDYTGIYHCIHLAAATFVLDSWKEPYKYYNVNTNGTLNILEQCRKYNISLTYISSYMYGTPEYLPIDENHRTSSNNPYSHSKLVAEELCKFYSDKFGLNVCILRPFNIYGAEQSERFLIPHIINQAISSDVIKVMDLSPKRDYVYIDDMVSAIIKTLNMRNGCSIYNVGSGVSYSVREIIDIVQKILGTEKPLSSEDAIRKNEINDVMSDCQKIKSELNWNATFSLEEGIGRIIQIRKADENKSVR